MLSLALLVGGASLLASSASALLISYDMAGSQMLMVNQVCNPCAVAVTGTITLRDDEAGNVRLMDVDLAHGPYEVASPGAISIVLERSSITLDGVGPLGSGSTLGASALFGDGSFAQVGTITCTSGFIGCGVYSLPEGSSPLPSPITVGLGSWSFDGLRNLTSAAVLYTADPNATETLVLTGAVTSIVPEPSTALLLTAGLLGLALRRRAQG